MLSHFKISTLSFSSEMNWHGMIRVHAVPSGEQSNVSSSGQAVNPPHPHPHLPNPPKAEAVGCGDLPVSLGDPSSSPSLRHPRVVSSSCYVSPAARQNLSHPRYKSLTGPCCVGSGAVNVSQ